MKLADEEIRPIAQKIYEERLYRGADGSSDNDWELAKEYIQHWACFQIKDYLEFIWCNELGDFQVTPRIPMPDSEREFKGLEREGLGDENKPVS